MNVNINQADVRRRIMEIARCAIYTSEPKIKEIL